MSLRVLAVVGPTAVGKSLVALDVAETLGCEIVSVDSMQTYIGMDIGTDKPIEEMRRRVRHHLLDLWPVSHDVTVAEFQRRARDVMEEIGARACSPLLVGGSGLYVRAVVDDLRFPPRSARVRRELEAEIERKGPDELYSRLVELDPVAAGRIDASNERRLVRALEVIELTGRRFSDNVAWDRFESVYDLRVAGLTLPRALLYERIAGRVGDMIERGLVEEARSLAASGMGSTARQALGYRQVLEAPGDVDPERLREQIVAATKRFARRQESWFKADPRVTWFDASDPGVSASLVRYFRDETSLS